MKHRVDVCWVLLVAFALSMLHATPAMAQQQKLSLQDAISMSIKNSKQLKGSQARIEEAIAVTKQAYEAKLPSAAASGSYLRLTSPTVDLKLKTGNPGGGGSAGSSAKISQAMYAMLNASLPIYAGGRIRYGIQSSKFLEQAARLDAENDQQAVIANTIDAYNNLYKARYAVLLVDSNLAEASRRVTDLSNMERSGIIARNDLLKAQLQQSNVELSLLDAQNNLRLANVNMNIMLGLADSTELIIDSADLKPAPDTRTIADFLQLALTGRKDVQALDYRTRAAEIGVKVQKAQSLPNLALTGGYIAIDVPNALTVYNAVNLGVGVQYNIANIWKKGGIAEAKARVKEAEAGREQLTDAIHLQVTQAYNNYISSQKKIDVYATAIAQAEENFRVVNNKFNNGLATVTEVLDADVARLQARLNQTFAISDAFVAYNHLLQVAGLLNNPANSK